MASQLILGISILVILHEFGHYLAARAFGIKVEKFYLFLDIWSEVRTQIKIVPRNIYFYENTIIELTFYKKNYI